VVLLIGNDWRNKGLPALLPALPSVAICRFGCWSLARTFALRSLRGNRAKNSRSAFSLFADLRCENFLRRGRPSGRSFSRGFFQLAGARSDVLRSTG